uniref:Uncharacterized protein n=1 Tax=Tetraselmis chuii TaxID=63592 RepID=A0A7S1SRK0_9CHLO|mmetsp:Transcript_24516/g.43640  ORF Transcript_24516/g.43640 Transcript_24516/m.43640 type:complete len:229 (+) Transcript_24516:138-824(+)|eukprot:CAMPEP_0177765912 /NCGR_PEP_ID=MMETSP0491_2-20121128/8238_1 /TAXON_ID=63592 /ORGANISM="Tetraselmis chuii, Strain PLY429" /LENGTH=228 /DNA_ID=CAMNT_0019282279 /DNA_START=129 /DNA_END=815 /DNA_ORIENTATION=+
MGYHKKMHHAAVKATTGEIAGGGGGRSGSSRPGTARSGPSRPGTATGSRPTSAAWAPNEAITRPSTAGPTFNRAVRPNSPAVTHSNRPVRPGSAALTSNRPVRPGSARPSSPGLLSGRFGRNKTATAPSPQQHQYGNLQGDEIPFKRSTFGRTVLETHNSSRPHSAPTEAVRPQRRKFDLLVESDGSSFDPSRSPDGLSRSKSMFKNMFAKAGSGFGSMKALITPTKM